MSTTDMALEMSPEKLRKIKKLYKDTEGDTFVFEGREIYKGYAKYLIEYCETLFKKGASA